MTHGERPDLAFELVGLVTSAFMVFGVAWIAPLFHSMSRFQTEQKKLIDDLRIALEKINTLKGLLPICSACKKIRDDKGYWNQIEVYISEHSQAEFSHGICPECMKKLYPEFFKNKD